MKGTRITNWGSSEYNPDCFEEDVMLFQDFMKDFEIEMTKVEKQWGGSMVGNECAQALMVAHRYLDKSKTMRNQKTMVELVTAAIYEILEANCYIGK